MNIFRKFFYQQIKPNDIEPKYRLRLTRILSLSILLVIGLWISTLLILHIDKSPGTIGDSFGMINALFSALAFSFLIYTSLLQTEELRLQRKELEDNRKELARAADSHQANLKIQTLVHADVLTPDIEIQPDFEFTNSGP